MITYKNIFNYSCNFSAWHPSEVWNSATNEAKSPNFLDSSEMIFFLFKINRKRKQYILWGSIKITFILQNSYSFFISNRIEITVNNRALRISTVFMDFDSHNWGNGGRWWNVLWKRFIKFMEWYRKKWFLTSRIYG